MRIGMSLNYAGGFAETVEELADYERAGLDIVFVPEAYSYDAVSQLGFIAARTSRLQIASGILQLYSRTPASQYADISHSVSLSTELSLTTSTTRSSRR